MTKFTPLYAAIGLVTLSLSSVSFAESDLMEIYQQAVKADTGLIKSRNDEKIAKAQVDQGLARLLPSVNGSINYGASSQGDDEFDIQFDQGSVEYGVTVAQPVFYKNAFHYYDAFKERAKASKHLTQASEQGLMIEVANMYVSVLKAQNNMNLAKSELKAIERQLEQTEQRYEVGLVAITDVLDARASYDAVKVQLINSEIGYRNSLQNLATLVGKAPSALAGLPADFKIPKLQDITVDSWIDTAHKNNPGLLAQNKTLNYFDLSHQAKKSEMLPTVDASLSYNYTDYMEENAIAGFEDGGRTTFGIRVSIPIYSGGQRKAEILEAGLNQNSALQDLELNKRNIDVNIRSLFSQVQSSLANIDAQKQVVTSRESALQATEVGYEVGTRNIVEVLNAQKNLFGAQLQYQTAKYDHLLLQLQLKQAAGILSEKDLQLINGLLI